MVEFRGCGAGYGNRTILTALNLQIAIGETIAVIGRSGSGKTTLLHMAAGLHRPECGAITIDSRPVRAGDPAVGLVLQHYGLFPWMRTIVNTELGLRLRGVGRQERRAQAHSELERFGLFGLAMRFPAQLSGGQRQRVALARTTVLRPRLLLLDEPFAALDALTREELQADLLQRGVLSGSATILVTHSVEEAVFLADRIGVLHGNPASLTLVQNPWNVVRADRRSETRADIQYARAVAELRATVARLVGTAPRDAVRGATNNAD